MEKFNLYVLVGLLAFSGSVSSSEVLERISTVTEVEPGMVSNADFLAQAITAPTTDVVQEDFGQEDVVTVPPLIDIIARQEDQPAEITDKDLTTDEEPLSIKEQLTKKKSELISWIIENPIEALQTTMMAIAALMVAKKAYQERGVGGAVESGLGLSPGIISELREVQE
ncbi:hypothetical protein HRU45_03035 [Candidatus Dependentiae bacterium]|nr:hypothetical protein [Candidatus Dependentiae bacterium]